jgi:hypothetical protein
VVTERYVLLALGLSAESCPDLLHTWLFCALALRTWRHVYNSCRAEGLR